MNKIENMAQWYEDDAFTEHNFEPDVMHHSYHDTLDEAKRAAFKSASQHGAMGVAYVHVCHHPLSNKEDYYYVNEVFKNKWSGWRRIDHE